MEFSGANIKKFLVFSLKRKLFLYFEKRTPETEFSYISGNGNPKKNQEVNYTAIKDRRNLYKLEKETKTIKHRILRDVKNLFEHKEEEHYYKPVRVSNFWSKNYIEYENNSDTNRTLSVEEYLNITGYHKQSQKIWHAKIQLTIANNFH